MNKVFNSFDEAVSDIPDNSTLMIDGFAGPGGTSQNLIAALRNLGSKNLTIISNTAGLASVIGFGTLPGQTPVDIGVLVENNQVKKVIASFPVSPSPSRPTAFEKAYAKHEVELELVPQGTLAERIRAGGAGIPAFFTPTGVGTTVSEGKEIREFNGKKYVLETALKADFALIRAYQSDRLGNLVYKGTSKNFNSVMVTAATISIVEVDKIVETGAIESALIDTPLLYVDRIVEIKENNEKNRLNREIIAMRVAKELQDGDVVNLGIGIPSLCSQFIPEGKTVIYHSESGVLNYGPMAEEGFEDQDLINASGQFLAPVDGMSFFSSSDAFAMIRGGHIDVTVLGALQVSKSGDLANWMIPSRGIGNVGGAMDLAVGAKKVIVAMEHNDKNGSSKIVNECSFPLTSKSCVSLIVTDIAVIQVVKSGLQLLECALGGQGRCPK